jgi:hypothetical protein
MWGITSSHRTEHCSKADGRKFPYGTSRYCQFTIRSKEPLSGRSVGSAGPLGHCDLCQRDVGARPPVAPLWPDYIRSVHGPGIPTCFHFNTALGFCLHSSA